MSTAPVLCPKCLKTIRRVSMSGGTVVLQGLPVPDPNDFSITLHPCKCTVGKGDRDFPTFMDACKKAYSIA
jgi:hypothetical protein